MPRFLLQLILALCMVLPGGYQQSHAHSCTFTAFASKHIQLPELLSGNVFSQTELLTEQTVQQNTYDTYRDTDSFDDVDDEDDHDDSRDHKAASAGESSAHYSVFSRPFSYIGNTPNAFFVPDVIRLTATKLYLLLCVIRI